MKKLLFNILSRILAACFSFFISDSHIQLLVQVITHSKKADAFWLSFVEKIGYHFGKSLIEQQQYLMICGLGNIQVKFNICLNTAVLIVRQYCFLFFPAGFGQQPPIVFLVAVWQARLISSPSTRRLASFISSNFAFFRISEGLST